MYLFWSILYHAGTTDGIDICIFNQYYLFTTKPLLKMKQDHLLPIYESSTDSDSPPSYDSLNINILSFARNISDVAHPVVSHALGKEPLGHEDINEKCTGFRKIFRWVVSIFWTAPSPRTSHFISLHQHHYSQYVDSSSGWEDSGGSYFCGGSWWRFVHEYGDLGDSWRGLHRGASACGLFVALQLLRSVCQSSSLAISRRKAIGDYRWQAY